MFLVHSLLKNMFDIQYATLSVAGYSSHHKTLSVLWFPCDYAAQLCYGTYHWQTGIWTAHTTIPDFNSGNVCVPLAVVCVPVRQ